MEGYNYKWRDTILHIRIQSYMGDTILHERDAILHGVILSYMEDTLLYEGIQIGLL